MTRDLLADPDFRSLDSEQAAFCRMTAGLCFFLSDRVPYSEAKSQLKLALAKATPVLASAVLHNLAVINYCEVSEHNERVLSGGDVEGDMLG